MDPQKNTAETPKDFDKAVNDQKLVTQTSYLAERNFRDE